MTPADRTVEIAVEVAALLALHGAPSAVIGAIALAVRGYPRATGDLDLATVTDARAVLPKVQAELTRRGYDVQFSEPDADDPLGGVLTVRSDDAERRVTRGSAPPGMRTPQNGHVGSMART
jgi:hypothetical protein